MWYHHCRRRRRRRLVIAGSLCLVSVRHYDDEFIYNAAAVCNSCDGGIALTVLCQR